MPPGQLKNVNSEVMEFYKKCLNSKINPPKLSIGEAIFSKLVYFDVRVVL